MVSDNDYRCPECQSSSVSVSYPYISCRSCGYSEPLIDFPISHDFHRAMMVYHYHPDPGPCFPQEDRNQVIIQPIAKPPEGDYYTKRLDNLNGHILFLESKINSHVDKSKKKPAIVNKNTSYKGLQIENATDN